MTRVALELPRGRALELDDGVLAPTRALLARLGPAEPVRLAFAAAHVVMRDSYRTSGHSERAPGTPEEIASHVDWESTLRLRARLDRLGLGVAEAMDTAQRFEVGWAVAARLIEGLGRQAPRHGFLAGAGSDHLKAVRSGPELVDAVAFQARFIAHHGGWPIVLPMPWLVEQHASEQDYVDIYAAIFAQLEEPLFVHWLGEVFHPGLRGYFPGDSFRRVMGLAPDKVRGAKLSLLDAQLELALRSELSARGQVVLTGDDLHFARLVRGGDPDSDVLAPGPERWTEIGGRRVALGDFSHALLGVLDAVAAPAAAALELLAHGQAPRAMKLLEPCEALGRRLFEPPTRHYKAGLAFLAWLNGLQANPMLANRADRARGPAHLVEVARLASRAGALEDAPLAARRLQTRLAS